MRHIIVNILGIVLAYSLAWLCGDPETESYT